MPQPPQFAALDCVSTHAPPQLWVPPVQTTVQVPARQASPLETAQAWPHVPQLVGSVCGLVHAAPHCVSGALQEPPSVETGLLLPHALHAKAPTATAHAAIRLDR